MFFWGLFLVGIRILLLFGSHPIQIFRSVGLLLVFRAEKCEIFVPRCSMDRMDRVVKSTKKNANALGMDMYGYMDQFIRESALPLE